jgi:hypothetical protein
MHLCLRLFICSQARNSWQFLSVLHHHPVHRLALALGDATAQQLPLAAAANELYKQVGCSALRASKRLAH